MHISYAAMKPDPETRTLTAKDLRERLMEISVLIKEAKHAKALMSDWPASATKLWLVEVLDNRLVDLMERAKATAIALTAMPLEVVAAEGTMDA